MTRQKETIIIVHGTFAGPTPGSQKWYQPGEVDEAGEMRFVQKLDAALSVRGSPARCWAHIDDSRSLFSWTGANSWDARDFVAERLAKQVAVLQSERGWRVHLVGHSHGGNIAVRSLFYMDQPLSGTLVTLGTPFSDPVGRMVAEARRRQRRFRNALFGLFVASICFLGARELAGIVNRDIPLTNWRADDWIELATVVGFAGFGCFYFMQSRASGPRKISWPPMLILNSKFDEALQLLHHLCRRRRRGCESKTTGENSIDGARSQISNTGIPDERALVDPFWPPPFFTFLAECYVKHLRREQNIERVYAGSRPRTPSLGGKLAIHTGVWALLGALVGRTILSGDANAQDPATAVIANFPIWLGLILFFDVTWGHAIVPVALAPFNAAFQFVSRHIRALGAVPGFIGQFVVRRRAWRLLQEWAMGLQGYGGELPTSDPGSQQVKDPEHGFSRFLTPDYVPEKSYKIKTIPAAVVERALSRRSEWLTRYFGAATEQFAKLGDSAKLTDVLASIAAGPELVHAAYYTDDDCISLIADWIAAADDSRQTSDKDPVHDSGERGTR